MAPDIINDPAEQASLDYKVADPEKLIVGHVPGTQLMHALHHALQLHHITHACSADKAELEGTNRPATVPQSAAGKVGLLLFEGGTKYDAFLVAASAQVLLA